MVERSERGHSLAEELRHAVHRQVLGGRRGTGSAPEILPASSV